MSYANNTHHLATSRAASAKFGILRAVLNMMNVARERRALAKLDNDALADLGLTAKDVRTEVNRPFWDAPNHWRC